MLNRAEMLMKQRSLAETEMEKISEINSALMGHQNIRQKIKYVDNIKRENLKLKKVSQRPRKAYGSRSNTGRNDPQENVELGTAAQKQRITILKLQRDLDALKSTNDFQKGRSRSRVGRAALSSRQAGDFSLANASFATSMADFADGKENDRWSEE